MKIIRTHKIGNLLGIKIKEGNIVIMDNRTEKLLRQDSLAETEKIFGDKHWSQFDEQEQAFSMLKFIFDNEKKEEHLKSVGDTYNGMPWNDFITLIESYGFKEGLKYDFKAPKYNLNEPDRIEEAILFYHPSKGLILWATSFGNKVHINGGKVYGMIEYKDWETCNKVLSGCSHGGNGEENNIRYFDYDIREGLIHTLNKIDSNSKLLPKWQGRRPFMWFLDYFEEKVDDYDYKAITESKIERCPKELQDIIGLNRF